MYIFTENISSVCSLIQVVVAKIYEFLEQRLFNLQSKKTFSYSEDSIIP